MSETRSKQGGSKFFSQKDFLVESTVVLMSDISSRRLSFLDYVVTLSSTILCVLGGWGVEGQAVIADHKRLWHYLGYGYAKSFSWRHCDAIKSIRSINH